MAYVRKGFVLLFVAGLTSLLGFSFAQPYDEYEGTTIVVSWPALAHFEAAATLIDQFTEETGIEVELDLTQYLNMKDRQVTEISKPSSGDLDVVAWVVFTKNEYVANGWLEPLAPFLNDPRLTMPDYDIEDIVPAYLTNGGKVGGRKGYLDGPGRVALRRPLQPRDEHLGVPHGHLRGE